MILMKDLAWVALILLLMPVIMAAGLVAVAVMLVRSLYRWARGNTTSTSRIGSHDETPRAEWGASLPAWARWHKPTPQAPLATRVLAPAYATSRRRRP